MPAKKVLLINPPWAALHSPSIALEQLASVTHEALPGQCSVEVRYLNHDFGAWIGESLYAYVSESMACHNAGFGEWFFRAAAYPVLEDNWTQYLRRYGSHFRAGRRLDIETLTGKFRPLTASWLDTWVSSVDLAAYCLIGITSMFQQNVPSMALARLFKARPGCPPLVLGGANCEGRMGAALLHASPSFDCVSLGHSLRSFPMLVAALLSNDSAATHRIDGVLTRRNCPSGDVGASRALELVGIKEHADERPLDEVVEPSYDGFLESYAARFPGINKKPELFFETSRGCWWGQRAHCTFCGLNGGTMAYRAMTPERAKTHIEGLFRRYRHVVDRYSSVDNILPKEYVEGLFPRLEVPPCAVMFYEVKADLGPAALMTLARARVTEIQPGIEALATSTLKLMRKGTTAENNVSFLDDCRQLGITPFWNLLVGFPGEGAASYMQYEASLEHLHHLPPPMGAFPVRFDRFSPYFVKAADFGLDLEPLDFYRYVYPYSDEVLGQLAYYFQDRNYTAAYVQTLAEWLTRLEAMVERWRVRYLGLDGLEPARLASHRDAQGIWTVVDTRRGERQEVYFDAAASAMVDRLQRPTAIEQLPAEQLATLEHLRAQRLLFEERGRALSLVRVAIGSEAAQSLGWSRNEQAARTHRIHVIERRDHHEH